MAFAERTAEVHWDGTLVRGQGSLRAGSGVVMDLPLDWASRSETAHGTASPEEPLAGAHASCYAMALALLLTRAGSPPQSIDVTATCALDADGEWYRVSSLALRVRASVPGLDEEAFARGAREADARCPISIAVRDNVRVRLDAALA
jgi:osmotically inducible protein OsmC